MVVDKKSVARVKQKLQKEDELTLKFQRNKTVENNKIGGGHTTNEQQTE